MCGNDLDKIDEVCDGMHFCAHQQTLKDDFTYQIRCVRSLAGGDCIKPSREVPVNWVYRFVGEK